jgi:acetyl-CoA carboxylase beta subunit
MTNHSEDIDKAIKAALEALKPVVSADGTIQPQDSLEVVMQMARAVLALEELQYQQMISRSQSGDGKVLH